jgi:hypothetical protein
MSTTCKTLELCSFADQRGCGEMEEKGQEEARSDGEYEGVWRDESVRI